MLSEKEIAALNNGAMGVTAHGLKVKVIEQIEDVHLVALLRDDGWEVVSYAAFPQYHINESGGLDIVGLWEDKPEPFNLGRALAGEPVMLKGNKSHRVYIHRRYNNVGDYIVEYPYTTDYVGLMELNEKFVMWKELEQVKTSEDNLPKPIREFGDLVEVWHIHFYRPSNSYVPYPTIKGNGWTSDDNDALHNGCYYTTKEDCQAVCDWLMNR